MKKSNDFCYGLQDQKIFKDIAREDVKPMTMKFLNLWLLTSKSNLLHFKEMEKPVIGKKEIRKMIDQTFS